MRIAIHVTAKDKAFREDFARMVALGWVESEVSVEFGPRNSVRARGFGSASADMAVEAEVYGAIVPALTQWR